MMIFNRRTGVYQNMEQISLLGRNRYQIPYRKAPYVHISHMTQECHQVSLHVNTKYTKKEDQALNHQKKKQNEPRQAWKLIFWLLQ